VDPEYGKRYRTLYERHWWWQAREQIVLKELHALNPKGSWGSILDIGCGDGLFLPRLEALGEVQGVEPDASLVSQSSLERWIIHLRPFDSTFHPQEAFSLILFLDVLEHLAEPISALTHAIELLAPGGILFVTVPAFPVLWTSHDDANHHYLRYTKSSFSRLADAAGMRILRHRYFFHWLFGPKLAMRGVEKVVGRNRESMSPKLPPGWLNRLLKTFSLAENEVLAPLRIPFGSSLLVVGTKR
jgi:2-polyprenyl-3-methyl-5-hydroxy-6-metoxy-1,4-benzoquinol methylase